MGTEFYKGVQAMQKKWLMFKQYTTPYYTVHIPELLLRSKSRLRRVQQPRGFGARQEERGAALPGRGCAGEDGGLTSANGDKDTFRIWEDIRFCAVW